MQLLNLMAGVMGTVHRIMTVTVEQHKVGAPIVRAVPILMGYVRDAGNFRL